jgi:hypothetical protein
MRKSDVIPSGLYSNTGNTSCPTGQMAYGSRSIKEKLPASLIFVLRFDIWVGTGSIPLYSSFLLQI